MGQAGLIAKTLAERVEMKPSAMSKFLHNKQSIKLAQLDCITEALGLPHACLYESYVGECYNEETQRFRIERCKEFILHCYQAGVLELAQSLLDALLEESKKHLKVVFEIAEELFATQHYEVALSLYERIRLIETNLLADHLSVSYLRYFQIVRREFHRAIEPAIDLERFLPHLPTRETRMVAYLTLARHYHVMSDWIKMELYADLLRETAYGHDDSMYGYALVLKGGALNEQARFEEAVVICDQYAEINDEFREFARGNKLIYLVNMGKQEYINDLISYAIRSKEIEGSFKPIMLYLWKHNKTEELGRYISTVAPILQPVKNLTSPLQQKYYLYFYYFKSLYHFEVNQQAEAMESILTALQLADEVQDFLMMKQVNALYLKYSDCATSEQSKRFIDRLLEGGDMDMKAKVFTFVAALVVTVGTIRWEDFGIGY
ncbi:hypothetical protein [Brevibacillus dissolubilis]|uniref:hypothetical protein n=1 Tax=Brevibacillus dissolubilis TaxID=1844116 RepID=UPI0011179EC5|nr:hypothetical protein [Brevibacillus dissolubilis]